MASIEAAFLVPSVPLLLKELEDKLNVDDWNLAGHPLHCPGFPTQKLLVVSDVNLPCLSRILLPAKKVLQCKHLWELETVLAAGIC